MNARFFRNLSIKRKLTLIIMLTSGVALLLACAAFLTYDLFTFRHAVARDLTTLANIVADNSTAALTFNDRTAAEEILASLRAKPHVVAACIYTAKDEVFAKYFRRGVIRHFPFPKPRKDGYSFGNNYIDLFRRVILNHEVIGTVYIRSDLGELYARQKRYAGIVIIVLLASSFVAFMLSSKSQRVISEPISRLAQVAKVVSVEKDYSVRAAQWGQDEVGLLIDAFNEMLTQIQERDAALREAHDALERRVEERTKELQQEVSVRKQAEEEIQELNEKLRRRAVELETLNKELEAFSYSVSHDLRAPLRSIDGFSQALAEDYADKVDEQGKDYLHRVRAATQRMGQLIDDLLKLSRATRAEMHHDTVDLSAVVQSIATQLQTAQPEREVEFVIEPEVVANGDEHLLRIVLENLLGNAWKFTAKQPRARIEFGVTEHEGEPAHFVRDNGIGFDMAYAEKLFHAFQRLHSESEFPGTGIGLATVQRIIHRHRGCVWAEGKVGEGATFYFTL